MTTASTTFESGLHYTPPGLGYAQLGYGHGYPAYLGQGNGAPEAAGILAVGSVAGVGSAALGGALVGGLSAANWHGAGTGALASGGLSAASYGAVMALGGQPVLGIGFLALGAGGLTWAIMRWNKKRKRRR